MKTIDQIRTTVIDVMNERFRNPTAFEDFAPRMVKEGIVRLHFDAFRNTMSFYTVDQFVHTVDLIDLIEAQSEDTRKGSPWISGEHFESHLVEKAIRALDSHRIDFVEFHKMLLAAGVVECLVYLLLRKIYYMGCDGQYFLENY